jgi:hypothetical protein
MHKAERPVMLALTLTMLHHVRRVFNGERVLYNRRLTFETFWLLF